MFLREYLDRITSDFVNANGPQIDFHLEDSIMTIFVYGFVFVIALVALNMAILK